MRHGRNGDLNSPPMPGAIPTAQRMTRQRDAVLSVIACATGPLGIAEIHRRAGLAHSGIGIATIYRTLKLLQGNGSIQSLVLPSGETRFEPTGKGHHEHFQCRKCHEVFTLSTCPLALPRHSVLEGGFVVEDHELTIYGTCPLCVDSPELAAR